MELTDTQVTLQIIGHLGAEYQFPLTSVQCIAKFDTLPRHSEVACQYVLLSLDPLIILYFQGGFVAKSHRVFIADDPSEPSGILQGNLRGVVSVVDGA